MIQQLLVNQQKTANDINVKVDSMYNDLNGKFEALSAHVKKLDVQVAQTAEAIKRQEGSLPGKTENNPRQHVHAITLGSGQQSEFKSERVYVPKIPYPKLLREPSVPLPSVLHQEKLKVPDANERHTPSPLRELPKLASPGQFKVPCLIQGVEFKDSLCDTGANVNVISHSVAKKLGISRLQPSKNFIEFADASSNSPHGFIADLKLQIGDCLVPVDFHVMEMKKDVHTPIILGSSFLTTVGAMVDFPNRRISFSKINKKVFYPILPDEVPSCMTATSGMTLDPQPVKEKLESAPREKDPPKPLEDVKPAKGKSRRPPKSFSKVSIIIPLELRDKGEDVITEELKKTMEFFPRIVSWKQQGSRLVAQGKKPHAKLFKEKGFIPFETPSGA